MTAAQTVRADGVDWPLGTFLDAYGYRTVDHFAAPAPHDAARFATVTLHGELLPPKYATDIRWHDTLAFRPIEHANLLCNVCGTEIEGDELDLCVECDGDAGWGW